MMTTKRWHSTWLGRAKTEPSRGPKLVEEQRQQLTLLNKADASISDITCAVQSWVLMCRCQEVMTEGYSPLTEATPWSSVLLEVMAVSQPHHVWKPNNILASKPFITVSLKGTITVITLRYRTGGYTDLQHHWEWTRRYATPEHILSTARSFCGHIFIIRALHSQSVPLSHYFLH
jgi:hypothetical protein